MLCEVEKKADFSRVRYGQCWEDADVMLAALDIKAHHTCLSIASAGDNTLAMLSKAPRKVIAIDLSSAQLACLELRVAAYKELTYDEMLVLLGVRDMPSNEARLALFERCQKHLSQEAAMFWAANQTAIAEGIAKSGKFERYFKLFRETILPLVHDKDTIHELLAPEQSHWKRQQFFDDKWNTLAWRMIFRVFFSRAVMGLLGRDPTFFNYVRTSVSTFLLKSTRYALTSLSPAENPYLQWILLGTYESALPYSLRPENFEAIKANLDKLEWRKQSIEDFLDQCKPGQIDCFNLSDIFEYMSTAAYHSLLEKLASRGANGGRLVYWNMLADRRRPLEMASTLKPLSDLADRLLLQNKAFFYSRLVVEEIVK